MFTTYYATQAYPKEPYVSWTLTHLESILKQYGYPITLLTHDSCIALVNAMADNLRNNPLKIADVKLPHILNDLFASPPEDEYDQLTVEDILLERVTAELDMCNDCGWLDHEDFLEQND